MIDNVQETNCYCLKPGQLAMFEKRPVEDCHVYCDREADRCGGPEKLVSVFSEYSLRLRVRLSDDQ
jgi:hypothetical protein